jgi:hypothetical protein
MPHQLLKGVKHQIAIQFVVREAKTTEIILDSGYKSRSLYAKSMTKQVICFGSDSVQHQ